MPKPFFTTKDPVTCEMQHGAYLRAGEQLYDMERLDHFIRGPSIHFVPAVSESTALYILKPKPLEWLLMLSLGKRAKLTPYLPKTLTRPSDEPSRILDLAT